MATQIFVNIPVKDLNKSIAFFTELGYTFNPQFTDEKATCMIVSETIYVMLLTEPFFKSFTKKEITDTAVANECILCLSADSREAVDEIIKKAVQAGATALSSVQDYGFMYNHGFTDLDGHFWEYTWMDPSHIQS
ncbi:MULTISPECIES: VOC family protein [unclassified Mucilaginibacter]|uniref:VOC family protein n=1 Tax=unclassified Mucilaginibacter TaxID=2617802 RepID=UPI0031F70359